MSAAPVKDTTLSCPYEPVPIEVRDSQGRWRPGYWLLSFDLDGRVTVVSGFSGKMRPLSLDQWRDPAEEAMKQAFARYPHTLELAEV